jgi:4-hydroxy-tetrahydrodipicolinate synthase
METDSLRGIFPAVVTPFNEDESIDLEGFREIINYVIDGGVHGVFVLGSQGESFSLTSEEKRELMSVAVEEVADRVPLMAGTGTVMTRDSIELTQYAESAGCDCASVITPFFIQPTQQELYDHYAAIAQSVSFPVLAYSNPPRTMVDLLPETAARLARDIPNFAGLKDSSGNLTRTIQYMRECPENFRTFVGRDSLILGALVYGVPGAVAATANVAPELAVSIYDCVQEGDYAGALRAQTQLTTLRLTFSLGSFPVVVKEALALKGLPGGPCRRPIAPISDSNRGKLKDIMTDIGLL